MLVYIGLEHLIFFFNCTCFKSNELGFYFYHISVGVKGAQKYSGWQMQIVYRKIHKFIFKEYITIFWCV